MIVAPPSPAVWELGHGYTATRYPSAEDGSDFRVRTLVVRERGRVVFRFADRNVALGVQVEDVTGDGVKDVLTLDYQDGSAGCGTYRLFGGAQFRELWVKYFCGDWGAARLVRGALVEWRAVDSSKTKASGDYIHCCWAVWQRTELRWRGGVLRVSSASGPPPPGRFRERALGT